MIRGIIGTAGHIDHGKTALVEALTGVRTDRLPEEKRRGITIDLGFAHFPLDDGVAGVVDVPGHEDFIRNMVAGASGFDLVLLVVAADEGVMPQTREHVAIAGILGVPRAIVALTKADLVEPDWLELARDDVAMFLEQTPFTDAPIVATSAVTGQGMDELRVAIHEALPPARGRPDDLFRIPVDRAFSVHGTGTVVTGTVWSGTLAVDEQARVLPTGKTARVRSLQVHGQAVDGIRPGQRAAIALAGLALEDVGRGTTIVTDGAWQSTRNLIARIRVLPRSDWQIEHGQRLRIHHATSEVMARALLLGRQRIEPGEEGWARLRLEAPIVARAGDRFVARSYSPVETIAGGEIVEPSPGPRRRRIRDGELESLDELRAAEPMDRVRGRVRQAAGAGVRRSSLPILAGATPGQVRDTIVAMAAVAVSDLVFDRDAARRVGEILVRTVTDYHARHPLHTSMDPEQLRRAATAIADESLVAHVMTELLAETRLASRGGRIALPGFQPRLTPVQEARKTALLGTLQAAGHEPPRLPELFRQLGDTPDLPDLIALLEAEGEVLRIEHELYIHADRIRGIAREIRARFAGRGDVTPAEFREVVPASRKHLLPILEYLDRIGVTVRAGEGRAVAAESESRH
jgi:selenocysteine-specific elongation factor